MGLSRTRTHLWPSTGNSRSKSDAIQTELLEACNAVYTLLEYGLLDDLRLWGHPLILGRDGNVRARSSACSTRPRYPTALRSFVIG
jgi:hypothetical protein